MAGGACGLLQLGLKQLGLLPPRKFLLLHLQARGALGLHSRELGKMLLMHPLSQVEAAELIL